MQRLKNKSAHITGGSRGIGRGIAVGYEAECADVIVHFNAHQQRTDEAVSFAVSKL
jgi:NAD(P)-dependent dehydrogenase (short-subunit alcohol dehydrogenase family)